MSNLIIRYILLSYICFICQNLTWKVCKYNCHINIVEIKENVLKHSACINLPWLHDIYIYYMSDDIQYTCTADQRIYESLFCLFALSLKFRSFPQLHLLKSGPIFGRHNCCILYSPQCPSAHCVPVKWLMVHSGDSCRVWKDHMTPLQSPVCSCVEGKYHWYCKLRNNGTYLTVNVSSATRRCSVSTP